MILTAGTNTNGVSTYDGTTTVNDGTLIVDGTIAGAGVIVGSSGTLGGSGIINTSIVIEGTIAPGNSPGTLTLGGTNLSFGSGGNAAFELGGILTTEFDRIVGIDALTLDGTFNVSLFGGFNPADGDSFDLLDFNTINTSAFTVATDLVLPALDPGLNWDTSSFTTQGVITVVPEPGSAVLLLGGLALLGARRRRG